MFEDLTNPFLRVIEALNESGHPYVIVGGFAVVMYGVSRFTPDMNIVVPFEPETLPKLVEILKSKSFQSAGDTITQEQFFDKNEREKLSDEGHWFFSLVDGQAPTFRIDLFLKHPMPFEELRKESSLITIKGHEVRICSPDHLFQMKKIAGRGQDLADVENLEIALVVEECCGDLAKIKGRLPENAHDRLDDLTEFRKLSADEKIDWLMEMLTELAKFCFV